MNSCDLKLMWLYFIPLLFGLAFDAKAQQLQSPNGKIQVKLISAGNKKSYGRQRLQVLANDADGKRLEVSSLSLGLTTAQHDLSNELQLVSVGPLKTIKEDYYMISGKRSHCLNEGNEQMLVFKNKKAQQLYVVLRAYNDGFAFRYLLEQPDADTLLRENTAYQIAEGTTKWLQRYKNDYEGFFPKSQTNVQGHWSYPALIQRNKSLYMLISEANITRGTSGSCLDNSASSEQYTVALGQPAMPVAGSWQSPWRTMIIGSLADVVESTLVTDLSNPSALEDTSWIVPGNVAWIYWAHNHSSDDFKMVNQYTDLAAEMGWTYNLIDWKWDGMSNGGNIEDAFSYARQKGVKPLLWYNSGTGWIGEGAPGPLDRLLEKDKRNKEYSWLKEQGVAGVKIDFFDGDRAEMMDYYIDLLEDAAKHQLMVNLHGSTAPRGWSRTYPNLMTMEAVYGAEWYNNNDTLTTRAAAHNATLPFTRNVIGPMDYTPGTFSDSQHKHITSHGHELALMIAFESAWQHRPDRPEVYRSLPLEVKTLLSELPSTWDDTKLLSGYPGESVVLARRKGTKWYIAGINGLDKAVTLDMDPRQLSATIKDCLLIKDGADAHSFSIEQGASKEIKINCLARGGFVAVLDTY